MEIEIKYQLPSEEVLNDIWNDQELMDMTVPESTETVPMLAVYYDTAGFDLRRAGIVMRVRKEGDEAFCTIKWNGKIVGGVHEREEVNIPVETENAALPPDASVFGQCEKGSVIGAITKGSALIPVIKMEFTRRRKKLDYGSNIMELALDCGTISTAGRSCGILEMELEHYSGTDPLIVLELGEIISYKYGLELQTSSKYSRGIKLLDLKEYIE